MPFSPSAGVPEVHELQQRHFERPGRRVGAGPHREAPGRHRGERELVRREVRRRVRAAFAGLCAGGVGAPDALRAAQQVRRLGQLGDSVLDLDRVQAALQLAVWRPFVGHREPDCGPEFDAPGKRRGAL